MPLVPEKKNVIPRNRAVNPMAKCFSWKPGMIRSEWKTRKVPRNTCQIEIKVKNTKLLQHEDNWR
jgi:hypothetical protein